MVRTRRLFTTAAWLLLALLGLVVAAVWLAVSDAPTVARPAGVSAGDVGRVYALLKRNSPLSAPAGVVRAATLTERDLELVLSQAVRRAGGGEVRPQVRLGHGQAELSLSLRPPGLPAGFLSGRWLNLHATLAQTDGLPQVTALRAGALPLPMPNLLARWAVKRALSAHRLEAQGQMALGLVNRVSFAPQLAVVAFAWPAEGMRQAVADALLPPDTQARVKVYAELLAAISRAPGRATPGTTWPRQVPLAQVLPPLFALAQQRQLRGASALGSPAEENRAALLALTLLIQPGALSRLIPASLTWTPVQPTTLTLRGREDFPQHFLVSAVIAAEGGGPLADAVGLFKEVADTQGGSGFSFNDIAADRAGTRFGLLAMQAPEALQQRLAGGVRDADLLPPVHDLPEFLTLQQFQQRYGGVGAPAYRAVLDNIEARLDQMALLAPPAQPR
jgi:hypothetical protein